ncbi:hypothetical protein SEA_PHINKY_10 [Microbacterium phage Phinky]|nr:hypothetical protein SEA_PHINKY_10 [Microbacterium phage Phinky]
MTEMKPLKITLYARVGDSEVLNELAVIERELQMVPITDANRAPGDAPDATMRVVDAEGAIRRMADAVKDIDRKRYMVISIDCLECNDGRANPVTVGEMDDFDEAIDLAEQRPYPGQEDRFVIDALNRVIVWSRASE